MNELRNNELQCPDPAVDASEPYAYRNRMDFLFGKGPSLRTETGIVPVKDCPIANKKINALLGEVWSWYNKHQQHLDKTLKQIIIRAAEHTDSATVSFVLDEKSMGFTQHGAQIRILTTSAQNVVIGTSESCFAVKGTQTMQETLLGKMISYNCLSFFQNNTRVAEKMVGYCRNIFAKYAPSGARLVDLYGGAGTFGVSLGDMFHEVCTIDCEGPNIQCAAENMLVHGIRGTVITGDATALRKVSRDKPLYAVTDPPRVGMDPKVIRLLLDMKPDVIVYVSCNPRQLAKELQRFQTQYRIESISVFDMFPQTPHIECVAELVYTGK